MSYLTEMKTYPQSAKFRKLREVDVVDQATGEVIGKVTKMVKVETAGMMATLGRWAAWGEDAALAKQALVVFLRVNGIHHSGALS